MRHAKQSQRLSRPSDQRAALVHQMVRSLIVSGQIHTTLARAKVAQRLADRLVTLGKDGSIHARRRAYRVLQDRTLVKQLFAEIAPRFVDVRGGYTRVVHLGMRRGDGARKALLAFSRLPAAQPAVATGRQPAPASKAPPTPQRSQPEPSREEAKRGLFEGLRNLWTRKKKGGKAAS